MSYICHNKLLHESHRLIAARNVTSEPQSAIRFQFRATQEQGLLLLLTDRSTREPVFGIGLYEGQVHTIHY